MHWATTLVLFPCHSLSLTSSFVSHFHLFLRACCCSSVSPSESSRPEAFFYFFYISSFITLFKWRWNTPSMQVAGRLWKAASQWCIIYFQSRCILPVGTELPLVLCTWPLPKGEEGRLDQSGEKTNERKVLLSPGLEGFIISIVNESWCCCFCWIG